MLHWYIPACLVYDLTVFQILPPSFYLDSSDIIRRHNTIGAQNPAYQWFSYSLYGAFGPEFLCLLWYSTTNLSYLSWRELS
ncbi:hypothetical protein GGS24DRAFT_485468 [Hypoxylon argillaceum]|nr:hypothetical protein GGS24DRAFT_485468 [Hypoxylon argillaceum]